MNLKTYSANHPKLILIPDWSHYTSSGWHFQQVLVQSKENRRFEPITVVRHFNSLTAADWIQAMVYKDIFLNFLIFLKGPKISLNKSISNQIKPVFVIPLMQLLNRLLPCRPDDPYLGLWRLILLHEQIGDQDWGRQCSVSQIFRVLTVFEKEYSHQSN